MGTVVGLDKQPESLPVWHSTTASHHKELAQTQAFLQNPMTLALDLAFSNVNHPLPLASCKDNHYRQPQMHVQNRGPSATARGRTNSLRKHLETMETSMGLLSNQLKLRQKSPESHL